MESEADQVGHSNKVAVRRKDCGAVLHCDGSNNGIRGGQADALGTCPAEEGGGIPIGLETASFQNVKEADPPHGAQPRYLEAACRAGQGDNQDGLATEGLNTGCGKTCSVKPRPSGSPLETSSVEKNLG